MKNGDRIRYQTIGGWYNSGTVKEIDEESCLVEVDTLGYDKEYIALPYFARLLNEEVELVESEEI